MTSAIISLPYFLEARQSLALIADDKVLAEDSWRVSNAFFGLISRPQTPQGVMLLIGGRSGLEAAIALAAAPKTQVFIVEPSALSRSRVAESLLGRAHLFPTIQSALAGGLPEVVDFVRVDNAAFDIDDLKLLLASRRVRHLCGEAREIQVRAIDLYRACREAVESFYWFLFESQHAISGTNCRAGSEVSVVVSPTEDGEGLDRCLSGLIRQSNANLSIVLATNSVEHVCASRIRDWVADHPGRVSWKVNGGFGSGSGRLAILPALESEYVAFAHSTDEFEPECFEELHAAVALRNADVAVCSSRGIGLDARRYDAIQFPAVHGCSGATGLVTDHVRFATSGGVLAARLYRREFLMEAIFAQNIQCCVTDAAFAIASLILADRVVAIPDRLHISADVNSEDLRSISQTRHDEALRDCQLAMSAVLPHANSRTVRSLREWRTALQIRRAEASSNDSSNAPSGAAENQHGTGDDEQRSEERG